jgi:hypothetical protein
MKLSGPKNHSNLLADNGDDEENITACERILAEEETKSELPMITKTTDWFENLSLDKFKGLWPWAAVAFAGYLIVKKKRQ